MDASGKRLITVFVCILLVLYLAVAVGWSRWCASVQLCEGLDGDRVKVCDPDGVGFVSSEEMTRELQPFLGDITSRRISEIDLDSLRRYLVSLDKVETATVTRLNNNRISVEVTPMLPIARIWPSDGSPGYYVNRDGKRMLASARYRRDVHQIAGRFGESFPPSRLFPLLDALGRHPDLDRMITMLSVKDSTDIIMIPALRGHVINFGAPDNADDKLERLRSFYRKVLPQKGWEYYDTISLKWDGQIVASRRNNKLPDLTVKIIDELENEADDYSTVSTDAVAESDKNP